jgi:hypothetical protein
MLTSGVVGRVGVHQVQSRGDVITLTLSGKDNVALVVGAT